MKTFMLTIDFNIGYVCERDLFQLQLNNELLTFIAKPINIIYCALDKNV